MRRWIAVALVALMAVMVAVSAIAEQNIIAMYFFKGYTSGSSHTAGLQVTSYAQLDTVNDSLSGVPLPGSYKTPWIQCLGAKAVYFYVQGINSARDSMTKIQVAMWDTTNSRSILELSPLGTDASYSLTLTKVGVQAYGEQGLPAYVPRVFSLLPTDIYASATKARSQWGRIPIFWCRLKMVTMARDTTIAAPYDSTTIKGLRIAAAIVEPQTALLSNKAAVRQ